MKEFTVYTVEDKRCPSGRMYHADGPAVQRAIKEGRLTPNETWDCDQARLLKRLSDKGVC